MSRHLFYAGSFGNAFHLCELDTVSQRISRVRSVPHAKPAHLALSRDSRRLYIASEMYGEPGSVAAYDISDPYQPVCLSTVFPGSQGPGYLSVSLDGRWLLGCGYFDGNVEVYPITEDGGLSERRFEHRLDTTGTAFVSGSFGQAMPRAHCVLQIPNTDFVLVTDYSGDRLLCFRLTGDGKLSLLSEAAFAKGGAPRHLAVHPQGGKLVAMISEFSAAVTLLRIDGDGRLAVLSERPTMKDGSASFSSSICFSADGRFLYIPNRANGNIAVLSVRECALGHVGVIPDAGFVRTARVSPDGGYLIAGDQNAGRVNLYYRNRDNGMCAPLAGGVSIPCPTAFVFLGEDPV